jgi:hypothetical protein
MCAAQERKVQTNVRLTPQARKILARVAGLYGVAQGDVLEILLRLEAARLRLEGFDTSHIKPIPPLS